MIHLGAGGERAGRSALPCLFRVEKHEAADFQDACKRAGISPQEIDDESSVAGEQEDDDSAADEQDNDGWTDFTISDERTHIRMNMRRSAVAMLLVCLTNPSVNSRF